MSLIEVLVASMLTLVLLVIGYGILTTTTRSVNVVTTRTLNTNDARLALDSLEANLRYADGAWVTTCAVKTSAAACRASTGSLAVDNAPGSSDTHQPACAQWAVTLAGLTERSFEVDCATAVCGRGTPAESATVASTVTSGSFAVLTSSTPATGPKRQVVLAHHLIQVMLEVGGQPNAVTVDDLVTPDNSSIAGRSNQSTVLCP